MPVHVDPHRERDLLIVCERPQGHAGAGPAEEGAHRRDRRDRHHEGDDAPDGNAQVEEDERLGGNRQRQRGGAPRRGAVPPRA